MNQIIITFKLIMLPGNADNGIIISPVSETDFVAKLERQADFLKNSNLNALEKVIPVTSLIGYQKTHIYSGGSR